MHIVMLYFGIRTHHDWPSQMHENLLISRAKTRAIVSVLTPLINKIECICEGHAWWVCIICVLNNEYHQNIKKHILIDQIFHFRRCQVILWQKVMEPFDSAWFGCCPWGHIPSDDYGIPTCSSNDITRSAEHRAYPSSKSLTTDAN